MLNVWLFPCLLANCFSGQVMTLLFFSSGRHCMIMMTDNTDYPGYPSYNFLSLSQGTWLPFEIRLYLYVFIVTISPRWLLNALAAALFSNYLKRITDIPGDGCCCFCFLQGNTHYFGNFCYVTPEDNQFTSSSHSSIAWFSRQLTNRPSRHPSFFWNVVEKSLRQTLL